MPHQQFKIGAKYELMELEALGICVEVTEAIVFISLLEARIKHVETSICWDRAAVPPSTSSQQSLVICKVEACGLGLCLNAKLFLQTLYTSAPYFHKFIASHTWPAPIPPVQLLCQATPNSPSTTSFSVEGLQDTGQLIIKETNCRNTLSDMSFSLAIQVSVCCREMEAEIPKVSQHFHLLHIINPEVYLTLQAVKIEGEHCTYAEYAPGPFKSVPKTSFKLATSLHHYQPLQAMSAPRQRLHLVKGDPVVLPSTEWLSGTDWSSGTEWPSGNLQICCAVGLVPRVGLWNRPGRKTPADLCCSHVHINIFGPAMLPLVMAGSTIPPSLLADWNQYGITLEEIAGTNSVSGSLLLPCLQYKVQSQVERGQPCDQVLEVFMLLEHVERESGTLHWTHCIKMANIIRKNVMSLLSVCSGCFHRALHRGLNKLLCNYASRDELWTRVRRAIPAVAEAVNSIVMCSNSQPFRENCKHLLQLEGDDTVCDILKKKLSELAEHKLDLSVGRDRSLRTSGGRPPAQEVGVEHQTPLPVTSTQEVGVEHQTPLPVTSTQEVWVEHQTPLPVTSTQEVGVEHQTPLPVTSTQEVWVEHQTPLPVTSTQEVGVEHQTPLPMYNTSMLTDNCDKDDNTFDDLEDYDLPTHVSASLPSQHYDLPTHVSASLPSQHYDLPTHVSASLPSQHAMIWYNMTPNTVPATILERNHFTPVSEDDFKWD